MCLLLYLNQDRILSESVGTIHAEWRTSYENLQRLQAIEKRYIYTYGWMDLLTDVFNMPAE